MISKLSVLVVDDSPFARTMLVRALVDIGFSEAQIFQAQNGEEVLQRHFAMHPEAKETLIPISKRKAVTIK